MSNLYIDDSPLLVLPRLVKELGGHVVKAMLLQQIHFMLQQPRSGIDHDGHHWVWKSADEWVEDYFIWLSPGTVSNYLKSLEGDGYIESTTGIKDVWDRTKYYRLLHPEVKCISSTDELSSHPQMNCQFTPRGDVLYTESTSQTTAKTTPDSDPDDDIGFEERCFTLIKDNYVTAFNKMRSKQEQELFLQEHVDVASRYGWDAYVRGFIKAKDSEYFTGTNAEHIERLIHSKQTEKKAAADIVDQMREDGPSENVKNIMSTIAASMGGRGALAT